MSANAAMPACGQGDPAGMRIAADQPHSAPVKAGRHGSIRHAAVEVHLECWRGAALLALRGRSGGRRRLTSNSPWTGSSRARPRRTSSPSTRATTRPRASTSRSTPARARSPASPASPPAPTRSASSTSIRWSSSATRTRTRTVKAVLMVYDKPPFAIVSWPRPASTSRRIWKARCSARRRRMAPTRSGRRS